MRINIGLIKDRNTNWWQRFEEELQPYHLPYRLIDIEADNWLDDVTPCTHIIWRPNLSDPFLRQAQEKLSLIHHFLGIPTFPDAAAFWHYDNKNAQYYIAAHSHLKMVPSFVSYSYQAARHYLDGCVYPLVSKSASGAASTNVRLLRSRREALRELRYLFNRTVLPRATHRTLQLLGLKQTKYSCQKHYVHFQQFIPDNPGDFRVTTIGPDRAFAFVRDNRTNDFRASGSGRIRYDRDLHREDAIRYCLTVSRDHRFDTMAYDILFAGKDFFLTEFSYTYADVASHDAPAHYVPQARPLSFHEGHSWPQTLLLKYLLTDKWGVHDGLT
jgi:hypothetical protein